MLVTFQMHNAQGPDGSLIRWVSEGDITHISIRITDNYYDHVWEARFGEKIRPIPWEQYEYKDSIVRTIVFETTSEIHEEDMLDWLNKQIGKGYDGWGCLSFIWFFIPVRNGLWFCSEFATVFLMKFIAQVERYDQKQTPYGFENLALLVRAMIGAYS